MASFAAYDPRLGRIEADIGELKRDLAELTRRVTALERDNLLNRWMLGFVLAFQVAIFIKLFLH